MRRSMRCKLDYLLVLQRVNRIKRTYCRSDGLLSRDPESVPAAIQANVA